MLTFLVEVRVVVGWNLVNSCRCASEFMRSTERQFSTASVGQNMCSVLVVTSVYRRSKTRSGAPSSRVRDLITSLYSFGKTSIQFQRARRRGTEIAMWDEGFILTRSEQSSAQE